MMRALWAGLLVLVAACGGGEPPVDPGLSPDAGLAADAGEPPADAGGDPCAQARARSLVSLSLSPAEISVEEGQQVRLAVQGTFDDGCVADVTGSLYYKVGDPLVARVVEAPPDPGTTLLGRALEGLAAGATTLVASTQEDGAGLACEPVAVTVEQGVVVPEQTETRGVWVTRFAYASADDVRRIVNTAADNHFNAVYFQVRGNGDAYYRSNLVPWWKGGGRDLGEDPGWDPLQTAIDAARARGIELHAYINAMSGWTKTGTTPNPIPAVPAGAPEHILTQHPDWVCKDASGVDSTSEYTYIAAEPGYVAHFADVVEELLENYEVDGIHMDRIRTPGRGFCHTPTLDQMFAQQYPGGGTAEFAAFQRAQIDAVVEAVYQRVLAVKPSVIVSAAVWGIYERLPGCSTSQGYADYHQDSLGWMSKGIIDQLNPMTYWDLNPGGCTDWGALIDSFIAGANGRQIVAGMHARDGGSADFARIAARIQFARDRGIAGHVVFASTYLDADGTWDDYLAGPYAEPIGPTPLSHR